MICCWIVSTWFCRSGVLKYLWVKVYLYYPSFWFNGIFGLSYQVHLPLFVIAARLVSEDIPYFCHHVNLFVLASGTELIGVVQWNKTYQERAKNNHATISVYWFLCRYHWWLILFFIVQVGCRDAETVLWVFNLIVPYAENVFSFVIITVSLHESEFILLPVMRWLSQSNFPVFLRLVRSIMVDMVFMICTSLCLFDCLGSSSSILGVAAFAVVVWWYLFNSSFKCIDGWCVQDSFCCLLCF